MANLKRILSFAVTLAAGVASAQWTSQTILLRPGWNAIYLEVQPYPSDCSTVFGNLPIESAWRFNRKQATVQFIEDPSQLVPNAPDWLTYLPPSHPLASQSQLFILEGGRPYLIKMRDNAPPTNWVVRGLPVLRKPEWLADSLNFVGFSLPTNNPPTFQSFFTNSAALATNKVDRLVNGLWGQLNTPACTLMQRGEAFWIRSTGLPDYAGPLEVQLDRRTGLDFGRVLTEQILRIRNPSTNILRTVFLRQIDSDPVPSSSGYPAKAGSVPLSYWRDDFPTSRGGWANLPPQLQIILPPTNVWELRLEVRRRDMVPDTLPVGVSSALYQSLLEVTESSNSTRVLIPVMSQGPQTLTAGGGRGGLFAAALASGASNIRTGLWVGSVSINKVSEPSSASPLETTPTASEFSFRILLHVDKMGEVKLLQKVLQMWRPGQTNEVGVVTNGGRFALFTDEKKITPDSTGATVRNGKLVGRRFSSAAFGFRDPQPMTQSGNGNFGDNGSIFACNIVMWYTNALNPFVHRYHPDHDNLSDRTDANGNPMPLNLRTNDYNQAYTSESPTITRSIQLTFTTNRLNNLSGFGDKHLSATYDETIKGLHATPLKVSGEVFLDHASDADTLDPPTIR